MQPLSQIQLNSNSERERKKEINLIPVETENF